MISIQTLSISEKKYSTTIDPLPSWKQGRVKERILNFIRDVIDLENPNYIPPEDRIAVMDNDGTLWAEKPTYFQGIFVLDRLEELSKSNPELKRDPLIKQLLNKDFANLHLSKKDIMSLVLLTHSNITQLEFNKMVNMWIKTAQHPHTRKKFVQMVYQPMIELIDFLKHNYFKTFIVSAGGVDFVRESLSDVYGIPSDQIIGGSIKFRYVKGTNRSKSSIFRESKLAFYNDNEVKPENIQFHIGKVPVLAVGNSDGDLEMLTYTEDNIIPGRSLQILVHHDDAMREYSYDTHAKNALIEAQNRNWITVSMKDDFKIIYPNMDTTK